MPYSITITVRNLDAALKQLQDISDRVQQPKEALARATNAVAKVWRRNFDTEGNAVGGWADLGDMAQAMREWQGFEPEHPILYRYGDLRAVAVEFFENASNSGSETKTDGYLGQTTTGTLTLRDKVAVLEAHGWKVANQWGHPNKNGLPDTPARPFWYVDSEVSVAARDAVRDWVLDEVLK